MLNYSADVRLLCWSQKTGRYLLGAFRLKNRAAKPVSGQFLYASKDGAAVGIEPTLLAEPDFELLLSQVEYDVNY